MRAVLLLQLKVSSQNHVTSPVYPSSKTLATPLGGHPMMVVPFPGIIPVCHQTPFPLSHAGNSLTGGRSSAPEHFLEMFCIEQTVAD